MIKYIWSSENRAPGLFFIFAIFITQWKHLSLQRIRVNWCVLQNFYEISEEYQYSNNAWIFIFLSYHEHPYFSSYFAFHHLSFKARKHMATFILPFLKTFPPVLYFVVQVSYNDIKQKRNRTKVRSMNILDQNPLTSDFWGSQSQHPIWDIARINGNKKQNKLLC